MKNLKSLSFLLASVVILAISCTKGAAGPKGDPGPQGPAGPDSVLHSAWITLSMTQNIGSANDTFYTQNLNVPALTQRILDSGIVLTYLSVVDSSNITNVVNASVYFTSEVFKPQQIDLLSLTDYTGFSYRYVIIPGTIVAQKVASGPAKGLTLQQLQNMSFAQVQRLAANTARTVNP